MTVLGQGWVVHVLRVIASVYKCTVLWQLTEGTVYQIEDVIKYLKLIVED